MTAFHATPGIASLGTATTSAVITRSGGSRSPKHSEGEEASQSPRHPDGEGPHSRRQHPGGLPMDLSAASLRRCAPAIENFHDRHQHYLIYQYSAVALRYPLHSHRPSVCCRPPASSFPPGEGEGQYCSALDWSGALVPLPPWWGKGRMGGEAGHLYCADVHPHPALPRRGEGTEQCLTAPLVPSSVGGRSGCRGWCAQPAISGA
jgi:hypothetical protein